MNGKRNLTMNKIYDYTQPIYPFSLKDTEQKICKLVYKALVKNKTKQKSPNRTMRHWGA